MRTLAIFHRTEQQGFTLLEILLVLAITGLLVGVTVPQMSKVMERTRIDAQRQTIRSELESLGYRAFALGRAIDLAPEAGEAGKPTTPPFAVPEGWTVIPDKLLTFAANGVCTGAMLTLTTPDRQTERWLLRPPLCRAEFVAEG